MQRVIDVMLWVCLGMSIAFAGYLAAQPQSLLRVQYADFARGRNARRILSAEWDQIAERSEKLGPNRNAPTIVEFSDYECPFCRASEPSVDSLTASGRVQVAYHHLPLAIHPAADGAARSAICAEAQHRFPAMHQLLMSSTQWQKDSNWVREAVAAGVRDTAAFRACLSSASTDKRLSDDRDLASRLGVRGTPIFFTRRRSHQGLLRGSAALALLR